MTQIRSGNPFLRVAQTGMIEKVHTKAELRASSAFRAIANYFPEDDELKDMIQNALIALRRGIYWDRGSIVNLQV